VLGQRRFEPQFLHLAAHDTLTVEQPAPLFQPLFCLGIKLGQVGPQHLGVHAQQRRDLLRPKERSGKKGSRTYPCPIFKRKFPCIPTRDPT
jgi:hypothetical protein